MTWICDWSMARDGLSERRWDELKRKFCWQRFSTHDHFTQIQRKHKLFTSQTSIGVTIWHWPDLREGLVGNFRLQKNFSRLTSGEKATSILIKTVEQLRKFEFRWLWNRPFSSSKNKSVLIINSINFQCIKNSRWVGNWWSLFRERHWSTSVSTLGRRRSRCGRQWSRCGNSGLSLSQRVKQRSTTELVD